MDLINAAAVVAGGKNQVSANLGLNVPGLLSLTLDVAVGEPPQGTSWSAVGEAGIRVRTAQTRVRLLATIAGKGLLAGVAVRLPIYLQIAHAEARLDNVLCSSSGGVDTVEISAMPGVAEAWIGEMSGNMSNFDFAPNLKPANIVDASLVRVRGSAHVLVGNTSWSPLSFSKADIDSARVQTVGTNNVARSLVSSLVSNLNLTVEVLGLGIGVGPAVSTLVASTSKRCRRSPRRGRRGIAGCAWRAYRRGRRSRARRDVQWCTAGGVGRGQSAALDLTHACSRICMVHAPAQCRHSPLPPPPAQRC